MYYQNNLLDDLKPLSGLRGKTFQMTSTLLLSMFPSQSNDLTSWNGDFDVNWSGDNLG